MDISSLKTNTIIKTTNTVLVMHILQKTIVAIVVLISTTISAQTTTENYIKTTTYQTQTLEGQQAQVLESDKIETVNYLDGLGRAKQSIAVRAGGQGQGINLVDWTDDWTLGTGSTPLFNTIGELSENERAFGTNPFGDQSLLWRCGNDAISNADGGWETDYFAVDNTIGYRYSVWVKRTGSQDGNTYHGTKNVNNLNGTANNNPYFWVGDLPKLDTWYLIVGVVHPHSYTGGNSGISGVYDTNGNKVKNGTDFKWRNNTVTSRFRNYLYYAVDTKVKQYFWNPVLTPIDGNGEPISQFIAQSKPKDIVTHYEYDAAGRQNKSYLPYASDRTQNGKLYTNPLAELTDFYDTDKYENTTNPYSESIFEPSPLNRVTEQGAPGNSWKVNNQSDSGHTIKFDWRTNTANEVIYFDVNFTGNNPETPSLVKDGYYATGELYITITKDENWQPGQTHTNDHTTREYTDKQGRVVLKRTYNENIAHDTYYVYDDFGNLSYVIPPKVTLSASDGVSPTELAEVCYQYKYDYRNRLIEKKIPGKGWEYIVYNKLDQPILTQDANQASKSPKEWLFTKYDAFGRVVYTGIKKANIPRNVFQQVVNDPTNINQFEKKTITPQTIAGTNIYYTINTNPIVVDEILTINYYDDYIFNSGVSNPTTVLGQNIDTAVKGLPTGSKVRVLGTDDWITTVTYYDQKARPIYVHSTNEYLNTVDIIETKLDFTGRVLETRTTHTKGNNAAIVTIDTFTYDHIGRLLTQIQKINNQGVEQIVANTYDEIGQLVTKEVGGGLQEVDYAYNVRGWLTDMNDVDVIGEDLFTFRINYNDTSLSGSQSLYNGNISETHWKTANDNSLRNYKYTYDALNRITSGIDNANRYSLSSVSYDKNGNILNLLRRGHTNSNVTSFGVMDNLGYTYSNNGIGNKLSKVVDNGNDSFGFKDGTNTNDDFVYDANGNMIIDRNKGISSISYNHLNLPENITIANTQETGNISYIYDATGAKLKKIVSEGSSLITTEYAGNYIYKNEKLEFFNHAEGYIEPEDDGSFSYIYQCKDHLGNIRLSYKDIDGNGTISAASEIVEEKNYYPFGLQHKGYNQTITGREHNYGFGGKEEQSELGLEWIDITARNYDPAIGRWMNLDPLAEQMRRHSPYNYAFNSPIYFMDPDGMMPQGGCTDCPWYLRSRGENRKPVLTLGLHNIELPTIDRMEGGGAIGFIENSLRSVWNGVASTWNAGMEGQNMGEITDAGMGEMHKMADRVVQGEATQEDAENIAASVVLAIVKGKPKATRRDQSPGDKTFKTERAARRESFRNNNVPTSQANNFKREKVHGKNKNLLGANGEPSEVIKTKDVNGNPVTIDHHSNGHQFIDNNTYELPHYHGKNGNGHYSYSPGSNNRQ